MIDAVSCDSFHEQISAMLDGELSQDEQKILNSHLEQCASCRDHLEMMRFLIDSTKETMVDAPADLTASVMREIRAQGNVTSIRKTNNVLKFFMGHTFTLIAAAVAALVIFSPTVMNHLGGVNSSDNSAPRAAHYAQTAAAAAYEIRVVSAESSATTTAAAAVSTTVASTAMAAPTSTVDSIVAPVDGTAANESGTHPAAALGAVESTTGYQYHPHNDLDILPDFSACGSSYSSVILLDSNYLTIDSGLPYWLAELLPELTEKGFFSYAFLSEEQVKDVLTVTSDGQLPHYILPLHILDDPEYYTALNPESDHALFVMMKLDE